MTEFLQGFFFGAGVATGFIACTALLAVTLALPSMIRTRRGDGYQMRVARTEAL